MTEHSKAISTNHMANHKIHRNQARNHYNLRFIHLILQFIYAYIYYSIQKIEMVFQAIAAILTQFIVLSSAVSYQFNRIKLPSTDPQFMLSIRQIDNIVTAFIPNSSNPQYQIQTHTTTQYIQYPHLIQNIVEIQTSEKDVNGNIMVGIVRPSAIMIYNYNFTEQIAMISSGMQYEGLEFGADTRTVYFYGLYLNGNYRFYKYDLIQKLAIGYLQIEGTPSHFQFKDSKLIVMANTEENNQTVINSTNGMNISSNISNLNEVLNQTSNSTNITNYNSTINETTTNNTINDAMNSTANNTQNGTASNSTTNNTTNNTLNSTANNTLNSTANSTVNSSSTLDSPNNQTIITSKLLILDQNLSIVKEFFFPNPYIKSIKNLSFNDETYQVLGNSYFDIYDSFNYAAISQGNRLDIWNMKENKVIKQMGLGLGIDEVVSCHGFLMVSVYDLIPVLQEVNLTQINLNNRTNSTNGSNIMDDQADNSTNSTLSDNSTNNTLSTNNSSLENNTTAINQTNSTVESNSTNTTLQNITNSSLPRNQSINSTIISDQLINITVIKPAKILYMINQTTLEIHKRKWISLYHNSLTKLFCVNNHTLAFRLFTNRFKNLTEIPEELVLPFIEENATIIEENTTVIEEIAHQNATQPRPIPQYQSQTAQQIEEEIALPREIQDTIDFLQDDNTKEGLSIVGSSIPIISSTIGQNVIKFFNFNIDIFALYSMHPVKYTKFLQVFSKEMDLMAQLRIKPEFLDDIDLSKKVSFADQNERYKQTSGLDSVYLLEVLKEFYSIGIIVPLCTFIAMYLIRKLISHLTEYHLLFQIIYDIFEFYTQWWMLVISVIETNLSITVFYFFLQLKEFYCFAFANKLNMCVTLLLGFIIIIFLVAFYPMIYCTQDSKNTKKISDFTKYRLQGFFVMGIIKNYNIFLRSAVHGIFFNHSEHLLMILVINGSIMMIGCFIFRKAFKNRIMFVVCSALMTSLIIFDLLLFLYLQTSKEKMIDYEVYVYVSAMVIIGLSLLQNIIVLSYDIFDAIAQCRNGNRIQDITQKLQDIRQKQKKKCDRSEKDNQQKSVKIDIDDLEDPPQSQPKSYLNSPQNFDDIQFFSVNLDQKSPNKQTPKTAHNMH